MSCHKSTTFSLKTKITEHSSSSPAAPDRLGGTILKLFFIVDTLIKLRCLSLTLDSNFRQVLQHCGNTRKRLWSKIKLLLLTPGKIALHFNQACKKEKINLSSEKGSTPVLTAFSVVIKQIMSERKTNFPRLEALSKQTTQARAYCFHNANTQNWIFIMMPRERFIPPYLDDDDDDDCWLKTSFSESTRSGPSRLRSLPRQNVNNKLFRNNTMSSFVFCGSHYSCKCRRRRAIFSYSTEEKRFRLVEVKP